MVRLDHLRRLLGPHGLLEHAALREPRRSHGYCTDDNARALVVTAGIGSSAAEEIFGRCLDFVVRGRTPDGWHNRMGYDGRWEDDVGPDDSQGRVVWGLGVALGRNRLPAHLVPLFEEAASRSLGYPRSVAYALLGAVAALGTAADAAARHAISLHVGTLPHPRPGEWRWPEPRLAYDNARLPQAMLEAGVSGGDDALVDRGLALLEWLVAVESGVEGFSFTPVGGRGPGEAGPAFDQQPIEGWAMADACETAARVTGETVWWERAGLAVDWFRGKNDSGSALYDPATGAGYDGLEPDGVNLNCGAESTLAALGATLVGERMDRQNARPAPP